MRKRYKISLLIIMLLMLLCGISYAYWLTTHTQDTANLVSSKCFSITYVDENNISLSNQFPISDEEGLSSTPYTFTITNTCTMDANYQINLETLDNTTFDINYLELAINASGQTRIPKLLNTFETSTTTLDNSSDSRNLKVGTLYAGESKTFELRIWMYKDTPLTSEQSKTYASKIVVTTAAKEYVYSDSTGASIPELYQGLIPVTYDSTGNVVVANTQEEWYDYAKHNWANAVLVNCADKTIKNKYFNTDMSIKTSSIGKTMDMSEILQMYVWIPRYKYLLWNAENGSSDPQAITIVFEDKDTAKSTGSTNGTYLTHPAFTFGDTELNGIWVGKFEPSGTTNNLKILPNSYSLRSISVGTSFNSVRGVESNPTYGLSSSYVDTHMMKNIEWGATAYLSSSIYGRYVNSSTCIDTGCEIWINNEASFVTGCSGSSVSASQVDSQTLCATGYDWTTLGVNASTTGNQYGIYDMSGGAWEYVMGNMVDSSGNYYPSYSGLTTVETKYYDSYTYGTSETDHARGKLGDATKETLKKFGNVYGGWYDDASKLPYGNCSWFYRGGHYNTTSEGGIFKFQCFSGEGNNGNSFRMVLTAE